MQNRICQKAIACILALALALPLTLTGCVGTTGATTAINTTVRGANEVAAELHEKYEETQTVSYAEGESLISRDHTFIVEFEFDPYELGMEAYDEIASLYYDPELTDQVSVYYDWASEDKQSYSMSPWESAPRNALAPFDDVETPYGFEDGNTWMHERGPHSDWGNVGTMYLATWVDLTTGEQLAKPKVQIITVKGELATPKLSVEVTDEGLVQFSWNEVSDAKQYYIIETRYDEDGFLSNYIIGSTSDTVWSSDVKVDEVSDSAYAMNGDFKTFKISEDDWLSEYYRNEYQGEYEASDGAIPSDYDASRSFCVVAVNATGNSMYSNSVDVKEIASLAPYSFAYNMQRLDSSGSYIVEGITMMPSHRWVLMCDGVLSQKLINYDFDGVYQASDRWATVEDDGTVIPYDVELLKIPFVVEGTSFFGTMIISGYNEDSWKKQLEEIEARQEALRSRTGDVKREVRPEEDETTVTGEDEPVEDPDGTSGSSSEGTGSSGTDSSGTDGSSGSSGEGEGSSGTGSSGTGSESSGSSGSSSSSSSGSSSSAPEAEIKVTDAKITANSALSEYLALNMLSNNVTVDLSAFPEALDTSYLEDAWTEAFYQNPLVLGVSGAMISRDGKSLEFIYEDDEATRERKQQELTAEVEQVASEIFTSSMTAREKEFAINQYLCETVTYDDAALENAAENGYMTVDAEFYDSFTAYGALVNGVGVCASYAASFKLLADAADLDCVVVTGYLEGTLGHAWNRVDLGDGTWATVDSTNNDMDILPNALMNIPDSAVSSLLVEDTLWLMDSALATYQNEDDAEEYYHVEGLYYDTDTVIDGILAQLAAGDTAVVRTNYALSDADFYLIGDAVLQATGKEELAGFYWLGVIIITSDYSLLMDA